MGTSPPKRVSQNAPGDFYVEADRCLRCCLPHSEAPELMNDPLVAFEECYFRRQPESAAVVEHAIQALWVSELACLRYGGTDPAIVDRLYQLEVGHTCDHSPRAVKAG